MTDEVENKIENILIQEKTETVPNQPKVEAKKGTEKTAEPPEDPNWKAFRDARKQDRLQKEAAEKRALEKEAEVAALKAAMEAAFSRNTAPAQSNSYYQEQTEETEDQRIEKKVQAAIAAREAAAEKARLEREQQEYPNRLAQTYPDFHQTISGENLDYLDYHYPEISRPLQRLPNDFEKWADIYRAVKKFVPNSQNAKKDAARADANFNKPKSTSSPSVTQSGETSSAARLTEEKRAQNWERMQKLIHSVG